MVQQRGCGPRSAFSHRERIQSTVDTPCCHSVYDFSELHETFSTKPFDIWAKQALWGPRRASGRRDLQHNAQCLREGAGIRQFSALLLTMVACRSPYRRSWPPDSSETREVPPRGSLGLALLSQTLGPFVHSGLEFFGKLSDSDHPYQRNAQPIQALPASTEAGRWQLALDHLTATSRSKIRLDVPRHDQSESKRDCALSMPGSRPV